MRKKRQSKGVLGKTFLDVLSSTPVGIFPVGAFVSLLLSPLATILHEECRLKSYPKGHSHLRITFSVETFSYQKSEEKRGSLDFEGRFPAESGVGNPII